MVDIDKILAAAADETLLTTYTPVPEGIWEGVLDSFEVVEGTSSKTGEPYTQLRFSIRLTGLPSEVRDELGIEEPIVRGSIFLRMTEDGRLDPKRNQPLARFLLAFGLPPKPSSLRDLTPGSGPVRVEVVHRTTESGETMADARRVLPAD